MNISKTMFKNFARCRNFVSYYDLYINRFLHEVKEIDGTPVITEELLKEMKDIPEGMFDESQERLNEFFKGMFDEETGADLTIITNAQMEAFKLIFTEVERLAAEYISKLFNHEVIASENTYEQKKYEFENFGHQFYCYLDIYFEDQDSIKIFEVKSTTSKKYDDFKITLEGEEFPLFLKNRDNIYEYVGDELIGTVAGKKVITQKMVEKKHDALFNKFSKVGKYIYDLAVEKYIVENSRINANDEFKDVEYYLVVLNSEYHFSGRYDENGKPIYDLDENGNALFKIYDLSDIVEEYFFKIDDECNRILENLKYLTINTHMLGECCEYKKTTQCKFCNICMKKVLRDGSILEFMKKNYAFSEETPDGKRDRLTVYELINRRYYTIDQCRDFLTKNDNIMQYECYVNNKVYIDKERIKLALKEIRYPIFHLDFESYNCPLPRFKGERPYEQSLFQYSLHVENRPGECDLVANHYEFLAKDHHDRRLELTEQLIHDIDLKNGGCVMVYNKSFEKTRLHELAAFFPKYKKELDNINEHVFDLLEVLNGSSALYDDILNTKLKEEQKKKPDFTYYNNLMHGSFSIKKVLPLFTNLTYKNLVVKNGTEAIVTYGSLPYLTQKEYDEKYLALRVYCRQDTWAMVEILRGLREAIKNEN